MTSNQAIVELHGLIKTRDYLIAKTRRNKSLRASEQAMTLGKYDREKAALNFAIDLIKRNQQA